ncbi:MAG: chemotaxis protein CheW [Opitutae bacterium]|nr:chemotaxis protein CheW [Opitutae bacterium]
MESPAVFLAVRTSHHLCALPLSHVGEVMRPLPIEPLAGAPTGVRGLAVIRGRATPVLDLDQLLADGAAPASDPQRYVTLKVGNRTVALAVAAVLTVRTLANFSFDALPPLWRGPMSPAVAALGAVDRELFLVLETARLLPADAVEPSVPEGSA